MLLKKSCYSKSIRKRQIIQNFIKTRVFNSRQLRFDRKRMQDNNVTGVTTSGIQITL